MPLPSRNGRQCFIITYQCVMRRFIPMPIENNDNLGISEPLDLFGEALVQPRKRGRPAAKFTAAEQQIVLAELAKGTDRQKIAGLVHCSAPTLRRHLPALAGKTPKVKARKIASPAAKAKRGRPPMKFTPEAVVILVNELTDGTPLRDIAGLIGCSIKTLSRHFAGLPCWNQRSCGRKNPPKNTSQKPKIGEKHE